MAGWSTPKYRDNRQALGSEDRSVSRHEPAVPLANREICRKISGGHEGVALTNLGTEVNREVEMRRWPGTILIIMSFAVSFLGVAWNDRVLAGDGWP